LALGTRKRERCKHTNHFEFLNVKDSPGDVDISRPTLAASSTPASDGKLKMDQAADRSITGRNAFRKVISTFQKMRSVPQLLQPQD